jgi:flavin-dependent dehydrogenase
MKEREFDCGIIGGGVAGLCLAIQLARKGHRVAVFEKHRYPFHKVCGEYVSNESREFFGELGIKFTGMDLPQIHRLVISSPSGFTMKSELRQGGFGFSRFRLDAALAEAARINGVHLFEEHKVNHVSGSLVTCNSIQFICRLVIGAFGKSHPSFLKSEKSDHKNYVAVKYHVRHPHPPGQIALHNFERGYCGISRIEEDMSCLCYITHRHNLLRSGNNLANMEQKVLMKNPLLKNIFTTAEFIRERPVTISNIGFNIRSTCYDDLLFAGDAAGCISTLTGNGISMAARTSVFLCEMADAFLQGHLSKIQLSKSYDQKWRSQFAARIRNGRHLQRLFGRNIWTEIALRSLEPFAPVKRMLISATHGEVFNAAAGANVLS